jgi:hypothetical protein
MRLDEVDVELAILEMATEDENLLIELVWGLRTLVPDANEMALVDAAQTALGELVRRGEVILFTTTPSSSFDEVAASGVVNDLDSWRQPDDWDSALKVLATPRGMSRYYSSPLADT